MTSSKEVKIAHITAKQTIVVTLITALSGLGGAFIQKYSFSDEQLSSSRQGQTYIKLRQVDFFGGFGAVDYRVVIDVDGIPYSYPGRSVWKVSGAAADSHPFPLPINTDNHKIRFELIYRERIATLNSVRAMTSNVGLSFTDINQGGQVAGISAAQTIKGGQSLQISSMPFSGYYDVYETENGIRGSSPMARIHFEIETK